MVIPHDSTDSDTLANNGPHISEAEAIASLQLNQEQWEAILDMVNREQVLAHEQVNQREFRRTASFGLIPFILEQISCESMGGHKMVYMHNISTKGLGLIHIGSLSQGMACSCWPHNSVDEHGKTLRGTVRWCKQLTGHIYMSGVELDSLINVDQYMS